MLSNSSVLIVACYKIINSNTAGEKRVVNYIKALFQSTKVNSVFIYSNNLIYSYEQESFKLIAKLTLRKLCKSKIVYYCPVLIYPSTNVICELYYLIYFKLLFKRRIFLELNEVRKYSVTLQHRSKQFFRNPFEFTKNKFKQILNNIQTKTLNFYDGLLTISDNISLYYNKKNKNILQIPILSDIPIQMLPQIKFNYTEPFVIVFTGTVNIGKENLNLLCEAIEQLNLSNIELHLYGYIDSIELKSLNSLIVKHKLLNNVFYHGIVAHEKLIDIFEKSHLLILPRGNTLQNHFGFSTKLSEYMVSGRPVLITNVSDNHKYITDNVNGFIIEPDSVNELVNKMEYIYFNYNQIIQTIPIAAFNTAKENFDYKIYSEKLHDFLFE